MKEFSARKILVLCIFFVGASAALFAGGNKEIPEIPPVTSGTQYISPNGDGVQDEATITFSVEVHVKSKEGYVPEYGLQIISPEEEIIREVVETEKSDVGWFASLFRGYDLFTLEREISWDGTGPDGSVVDDGVYDVNVYVVDSSGNRNNVDIDDFVVDTQPPTADIDPPEDTMFSPNGDDVAEVFIVQQEGSEEELWTGEILDESGSVVKTFNWENEPLADLLWDGTTNTGEKAPDGTYTYRLSSTDLAGNSFEGYSLDGIVLDAATPMIYLSLTNPHFSPNGDGVKDTTTVTADIENPEDVVFWAGGLANDRNTISVSLSAEGQVPDSYTITGITDEGQRLPEGYYTLSLSVRYENGYRGTATERIKIDTTPPTVQADYDKVFSPNGDGQQDYADISLRASEEVTWEGRIEDEEGNVILSSNSTETPSLNRWDGTNSEGEVVEDGTYYASAEFTDLAGNTVESRELAVRVDNRSTAVSLEVTEGFSPNGDGIDDMMPIAVNAAITDDVSRWVVTLEDENEETYRVYTGTDELPDTVFWDGSLSPDKGEGIASEGFYRARLKVVYEKGDVHQTYSDLFTLDNTPPRLFVDVVSHPFAVTERGLEGEVFLTIRVEEETAVSDWEMDIYNSKGKIVRSYAGKGDPTGQIRWNGEIDNGSDITEEEVFTVRLNVKDAGGNRSTYEEKMPIDILIVYRDGKYYLAVPNIIFGAYKFALDSAGQAMYTRNMESLEKIAELYTRYPDYGLGLEGHALNIYLGGPREEREEEILMPLTENRAKTVLNALVELGIPREKLSFKAFGGQNPIASVSDRRVWWKNRRVEFVVVFPAE